MTSDKTNAMGFGDLDESLHRIVDDFTSRLRKGERVTPDGFAAQYPQYADSLRALLPVVSVMSAFAEVTEPGLTESPAFASSDSGYLGDFRIIREIGRGGMGVVYEAEQVSLCRRVALKVLPLASLLDPQHLERFKNESRAAAMLKHPHIVSVFQTGCERGVHYYAMDLVPGRSLAAIIQGLQLAREGLSRQKIPTLGVNRGDPAPPPTDATTPVAVTNSADTIPIAQLSTEIISQPGKYCQRVARLGVQVASALHYAHQVGIIHRDIKPSNILLDDSGCPWVADFGLAHVPGAENATLSGDILGTLRYMSPEQAAGRKLLDERTDVYSLGLTLFEFLTLQPAFAAADHPTLLHDVLHRDPMAAHHFPSSIPLDLQTILLKATAKEASDRYANAEEFSDDLERFLQQRPIRARPLGRIARVWRWCRRSPMYAGMITTICLLLLCVAVTAGLFAVKESMHRQQVEATLHEAQWQQYLSDMHAAMAAWDDADVGRALKLLERNRPEGDKSDVRGFEWHYLFRCCHDKRLRSVIDESSSVLSVAFSHDGRMMATGNYEGLVRIWDPTNGWLMHEFQEFPVFTTRVAFSPDDRCLASGNGDGTIHLRDLTGSSTVRELTGHTGQITSLLFSTDGKRLASGDEEGLIRIWDVTIGSELRTVCPAIPQPARANLVGPWIDNQLWVYSPGSDGTLRVLDTNTGVEIRSIKRKELSQIWCFVRVSGDGQMAATASTDGVVRLFDTETGKDLESIGTHGAAVRGLAFAPGDQTLASSDAQGKVIVWDLERRTPRAELRGNSGAAWPIAFSHDGQFLCTSGSDQKLRIWDVIQQPVESNVLQGHDGFVTCVAFSPDGRTLASGGAEAGGGLVRLWDVATGKFQYSLKGHTAWVQSVAFSPDGRELASGGEDGTVRLWDLTHQSLRMTLDTQIEHNWLTWVNYSRDGRQLISSEKHGTLRVWDRSSGKLIRSAKIGQSHAWTPALSPDGRYLVAGVDHSIVWLDYPSLTTIRRFPNSPVYGSVTAISPDGRIIASCGHSSNKVYLSSLDGNVLGTLDHVAVVQTIDFSPDGQTLVTGDRNHEVHLWDVVRREERATLRGHFAWIGKVRFSPDGQTIASSSDDATIRLWRARPE